MKISKNHKTIRKHFDRYENKIITILRVVKYSTLNEAWTGMYKSNFSYIKYKKILKINEVTF